MSVGLCLITHDRLGETLLDTAIAMLGGQPLPAAVISVAASADPEKVLAQAREQVRALDQGDGVIVLTDMFGATPSNIASALGYSDADSGRIIVIAGVNLPMLVRLLNYPGLSLTQLADKAVSGGREGIFRCDEDPA
jgi:PTS system ascorbate-specific IIA component